MTIQMRPRVKYVIGPDGSPLTVADLPPQQQDVGLSDAKLK